MRGMTRGIGKRHASSLYLIREVSAMPLSQTVVHTINATQPVLEEYGKDIAVRLHVRLKKTYPRTWARFVKDPGNHPRMLARIMTTFSRSVGTPDDKADTRPQQAAADVFNRLAPEDYPMLGDALRASLQDVLGGTLTEAVLDAWKEAFFCLTENPLTPKPITFSQTKTYQIRPPR